MTSLKLRSGLLRLRVWVGVTCSLVCCAPSATGGFDDKGYQHTKYDYRVDATHPPDSAIPNENLLGNDWKIDNFYRNGSHSVALKETTATSRSTSSTSTTTAKSTFSGMTTCMTCASST
jgi:hypothetical protein